MTSTAKGQWKDSNQREPERGNCVKLTGKDLQQLWTAIGPFPSNFGILLKESATTDNFEKTEQQISDLRGSQLRKLLDLTKKLPATN